MVDYMTLQEVADLVRDRGSIRVPEIVAEFYPECSYIERYQATQRMYKRLLKLRSYGKVVPDRVASNCTIWRWAE